MCLLMKGQEMRKYKNKKVVTDAGTFDSKREYNRFIELSLMEKAGMIENLQRQVDYVLVPKQKRQIALKNGRKSEICIKYRADFVYTKNGQICVEDTKGFATKDYIMKRKLMLYIHGIEVIEV